MKLLPDTHYIVWAAAEQRKLNICERSLLGRGVRHFVELAGWTLLPLAPDHAIAPLNHSDPFDELLLVQAQVEGLRLLTRDTRLLHHPLADRQRQLDQVPGRYSWGPLFS